MPPNNYQGRQKVGDAHQTTILNALVKYACRTCIHIIASSLKSWLEIRRGDLYRNADFQRNEEGQSAELKPLVSFSFSTTPPILMKMLLFTITYVFGPIRVLNSIPN